MIKLIAVDMDGTLLNEKKEISKHTVDMINKLYEHDIQFMITTGREYDMVKDLLEKNNLKCHCILMNGAEYRDKEGVLKKEIKMDSARTSRIISILQQEKIVARIFTDQGIYTLDSKENALQELVYRFKSFFPELDEAQAIEKAKKEPFFLELQYIKENEIEEFVQKSSIKKFVAFNKDVDLLERAKKMLREIPNIAVSSSFIDNLELTDVHAQKGLVLKEVSKMLGIKENEVMVMGDSFNDETMFKEFENSVAMENAIDEIKEMAKYITKTNVEDGVAYAMEQVLAGVWGND